MLRRLFRLGRRGAVASEFAIVAIFMTGLGFLSLEVVYAMVARGVVESGLERASRLAATGLGGPAMPGRLATFNTTYSNMVSGMIDYSGTITNTLASYERIDWVMNPPVGFTPATDLGQSQWYVVYESVYQHQLLTGSLFCNFFPSVGCDGRLRMDLRVMRQNEPF